MSMLTAVPQLLGRQALCMQAQSTFPNSFASLRVEGITDATTSIGGACVLGAGAAWLSTCRGFDR